MAALPLQQIYLFQNLVLNVGIFPIKVMNENLRINVILHIQLKQGTQVNGI